MKIQHFVLILALSVGLGSCNLFKSAAEKRDAALNGQWILESAEGVSASADSETQAVLNEIIKNAYQTEYQLLADGTYVRTDKSGEEKGATQLSEDGNILQLGSLRFEIINFDDNLLKLKSNEYIYTFKRK